LYSLAIQTTSKRKPNYEAPETSPRPGDDQTLSPYGRRVSGADEVTQETEMTIAPAVLSRVVEPYVEAHCNLCGLEITTTSSQNIIKSVLQPHTAALRFLMPETARTLKIDPYTKRFLNSDRNLFLGDIPGNLQCGACSNELRLRDGSASARLSVEHRGLRGAVNAIITGRYRQQSAVSSITQQPYYMEIVHEAIVSCGRQGCLIFLSDLMTKIRKATPVGDEAPRRYRVVDYLDQYLVSNDTSYDVPAPENKTCAGVLDVVKYYDYRNENQRVSPNHPYTKSAHVIEAVYSVAYTPKPVVLAVLAREGNQQREQSASHAREVMRLKRELEKSKNTIEDLREKQLTKPQQVAEFLKKQIEV
jgi:hypothetical protein